VAVEKSPFVTPADSDFFVPACFKGFGFIRANPHSSAVRTPWVITSKPVNEGCYADIRKRDAPAIRSWGTLFRELIQATGQFSNCVSHFTRRIVRSLEVFQRYPLNVCFGEMQSTYNHLERIVD
jgi:hypothetical protein